MSRSVGDFLTTFPISARKVGCAAPAVLCWHRRDSVLRSLGRPRFMHDLPLITTMAAECTTAWVFGLITHNLNLTPIVGYQLSGVAIGLLTAGFIGDERLAAQLAELGV